MLIFVLPLSDSAYVCMLAVYDTIYLYSKKKIGFALEIILRPPSLFPHSPKLEEKKRGRGNGED